MNRRSFLRAALGVGVAGPVALKALNYGSTVVIKYITFGKKPLTFEKYDPGILHDAKGRREV